MDNNDPFKFSKMIASLQVAKFDLPNSLGQAGQMYFQRNFDKQQFDEVPWEPRKTGTDGKAKSESGRIKGKALLVKSGRLRQSLQTSFRKNESDYKKVVWDTDVSYAKFHNFGVDATVRAHTRKHNATAISSSRTFNIKTQKENLRKVKIKLSDVNVKAHHLKIPKREFIGGSKELNELFLKKIKLTFDKVIGGK